ncbi:M16 family metallopeptidase [Brevirhabdus sp.]|uniref:M16 family metallopeptidase n=1 Tax=Brevirhabdus sp. TaxID=2004514 RepID=UPI0040592FD2
MLRLLFALMFTIGSGLGARAAEIDDNVTSFTLANGMEGVVIEDHRAPVVVNMVWYRAGSGDEPPGKSGIAHFLEHLMFKGTDQVASGEFSKIVAANGGSDNAFTSWDYTGYYQRVAADRLELMMKMEADRMVNLKLTAEDAVTERDVILEERNQRTDSDPAALFAEQRNAALYLNSPYGRPIVGWRQEVEALTLQDALDFYDIYYSPNDAVLVVAGDVDPDEVKKLAETYFGAIPRNPRLPERARPQEPPQLAERRVMFHDARVAQPYVTRSYLAPERDSGAQEPAAALTLLADLLGGHSATSFLGQRLEFDRKLALYTSAGYGGTSLDATSFNFVVVPAAGVTLPEAEAALDDALGSFLDEGVDEAALTRIKRQLRASTIYGLDSLQGQTQRYGAALASGLTVEDVQAWPEILQSVTADQIMTAARDLLDKRRSVTGYFMGADAPSVEGTQPEAAAPDTAAPANLPSAPPVAVPSMEVTQ